MMNKNFEKWATGYSGFDGGNPNGKIWLCGIEWGGKSPLCKKEIEELFLEDVENIPTGYDCYETNMIFPYNLKFMKIMASVEGINFIKNNKYDRGSIVNFNKKEKFFTKTSNYFKLNLLPFNFPSVDSENWTKLYKEITGFGTKKEYMDWSLKERFSMFQNLTSAYNPSLIIAVGTTHIENFKNAFGYNDRAFCIEKYKCVDSKEYQYYYDGKEGRLIMLLPFLGGRYGLNSNCLLIETGKIIKKLLDEKGINIDQDN